MFKKLVLGGAAAVAFAGLGLSTPAAADAPWPTEINASSQSNNTVVCGNKAIGDITIAVLNLTPITNVSHQQLNCQHSVRQD